MDEFNLIVVKINGTIMEYENKEKHQIYIETLMGKKTYGYEKKLHYEYENNYKVHRNRE